MCVQKLQPICFRYESQRLYLCEKMHDPEWRLRQTRKLHLQNRLDLEWRESQSRSPCVEDPPMQAFGSLQSNSNSFLKRCHAAHIRPDLSDRKLCTGGSHPASIAALPVYRVSVKKDP